MKDDHVDLAQRPQDSQTFSDLATAVFAYMDKYGVREAQKALNTMKETVNTWSEFRKDND